MRFSSKEGIYIKTQGNMNRWIIIEGVDLFLNENSGVWLQRFWGPQTCDSCLRTFRDLLLMTVFAKEESPNSASKTPRRTCGESLLPGRVRVDHRRN